MSDVTELSEKLSEIADSKVWDWSLRIENRSLENSDSPIILDRELSSLDTQTVKGKISLKRGFKILNSKNFKVTIPKGCSRAFLPLMIRSPLLSSKKKLEQFSVFVRFTVECDDELSEEENSDQSDASESTSNLASYLSSVDIASLTSPSDNENNITIGESSSTAQKFSEDIMKLLDNESECDISFRCRSDTVKAHKLILRARSPVFEAMFRNNFQESQSGVVDVEDVSSVAFRCLLKYLYSGVIPKLTVSLANDVLHAAEKYQIPELKNACLEFLESSVTNDNVLTILEVASLYDEHLKIVAMNHISKNIHHIRKLPSWVQLQKDNPSLIIEAMDFVINGIEA